MKLDNVLSNQEIEQLLKAKGYTERDIKHAKVFRNDGQHLAIDLTQAHYIDLVGFVYYGVWISTLDETGNLIETKSKKLEKLVNKNLVIVRDYMEKNDLA
ncbi:hypothetical protein [Mammaliicoccus virus vB_MscM-PMS2]|nr:hypothetical protein [Mammaliicoccus virus vB_MscM-PMS2]